MKFSVSGGQLGRRRGDQARLISAISRRWASRAAPSSSSRSSRMRCRSRTRWRRSSISLWVSAVSSGPKPLHSAVWAPSSSDRRASRSLMRRWRRRACSCRLASASRDRRLTVVGAWPGSVPAAGGSAAASTAAYRSGWRWMNERCTRARAATAETLISAASAVMAAMAWCTRSRRRATSRWRAWVSGCGAVIASPAVCCAWAQARHPERDALAGLADHGDGLPDLVSVVVAEAGQVVLDAADQRPQLVDLFVGWGQVLAGPVLEVGGGADAFPVGEQLL